MKRIFLYILVVLCHLNLLAQNAAADSLRIVLSNHTKLDTTRVNLMNEIIRRIETKYTDSLMIESEKLSNALNYTKGKAAVLNFKGYAEIENSNFLDAIKYYTESLNLFEEIGYKIGISNCLNFIGNAYYFQGNYSEALVNYEKSLAIDLESNDSIGIPSSFINIGNIYADMGYYDKAIASYQKAGKIYSALNNDIHLSIIYSNIGSIYAEQGNFPMALENFNKGLKLYQGQEEKLKDSYLLTNLSSIYTSQNKLDEALEIAQKDLKLKKGNDDKKEEAELLNTIGSIYFKQKKNDKALEIFNKSLESYKNNNNKPGIIKSLVSIADIKMNINDLNSAYQNYNEALIFSQQIGNPFWECNAQLGLAKVFLNKKNYKKTLYYALKAKKNAKELELLEQQKEVASILYTVYKKQKKYTKALENHEMFKVLNDSIFNEKNIEKSTQLEYEYKYQTQIALANERELALTKKIDTTSQSLEKSQRNSLFGIIGILLLALISGATIFYLKLKEAKDKVAYSTMEQKLLRSQMTPHFIFNSLSVLQGIILNKEEEKSVFYLSKFSKLLRIILENSREKTVLLNQELEAIENYITLQNINIEPPCNYNISVDENIDTTLFSIPPMLIQPFIENVVEHAFGSKKNERKLNIHISFINDKLKCTIEDNGIGIEAHSKEIRKKSKRSLATTITAERLEILSKDFKFKGSITVEDRIKFNEQGTLVTLIIPYFKK